MSRSSLRRVPATILSASVAMAALLGSLSPAAGRPTATFTMAPPPAGPPIALVGGSVVDVLAGSVIANGVVLIKGDRIIATGPAAVVVIPPDARVIRMDGKYLIPGLINCHVHLGLKLPGAAGAALADETDAALALRMAANARRTLESGVTTVRLVGENHGADFDLKAAINRGETPGPRIETAGEIIVPSGGHGSLEADGPYAIAARVREQIKQGATWIKIAISGGIADTHGSLAASPMLPEELKAAIDVAHRNDVRITAHNGSPEAAEEAIADGIDGFEHGYFLQDKQLKEMKKKGVWLVPTAVVTDAGAVEFYKSIGSPPWYLDRVRSTGKAHRAMLESAIRLGVNISLGTDQLPFEPNSGTTATIHEAEIYVDAGMTPMSALRAATIEAARMLRLESDVGVLAPGRYADIAAVDADPTRDIRALREISFVMKGGVVVRQNFDAPATP